MQVMKKTVLNLGHCQICARTNYEKFFDLRITKALAASASRSLPAQLLIHSLVRLILGLVHRPIQNLLGRIQGLADRLMHPIEKGPDYGLVDGLVLAGLCLRMEKRRQMAFSLAPRFFETFLDVFLLKLSGLQLLLNQPI